VLLSLSSLHVSNMIFYWLTCLSQFFSLQADASTDAGNIELELFLILVCDRIWDNQP
jgi:hypothetical protein